MKTLELCGAVNREQAIPISGTTGQGKVQELGVAVHQ